MQCITAPFRLTEFAPPQRRESIEIRFCGGVYAAAKNTLCETQCRSPACGGARRGVQRNFLT